MPVSRRSSSKQKRKSAVAKRGHSGDRSYLRTILRYSGNLPNADIEKIANHNLQRVINELGKIKNLPQDKMLIAKANLEKRIGKGFYG